MSLPAMPMPGVSPCPEPFAPKADPAALEDLRARLRATRWPDAPEDAGWSIGADLDYLRDSSPTGPTSSTGRRRRRRWPGSPATASGSGTTGSTTSTPAPPPGPAPPCR